MKLISLLPIGKITPRTTLNEDKTITIGRDGGVYMGIDDFDDVVFDGSKAGLDDKEFKSMLETLWWTPWFKKLVLGFARRKQRNVSVISTGDGIKFK